MDIYYGESAQGQWLSVGFNEPNNDGTNNNSTNINDFITNGTGLTTFYDTDPTTQVAINTAFSPLVYDDYSLRGLYKVSFLAVYFNRGNFGTSKNDLCYIASDELFNPNNGTYKDYIIIDENPIRNDANDLKHAVQFSNDMTFLCELNGHIQIMFRRGINEPVAFRYAMVILDVEPVPF